MQKGYQGASLRNICKNAGVTTGALYFFFRDKEELFDYLVQPVLEMVQNMMEAHMKQELLEVENVEMPLYVTVSLNDEFLQRENFATTVLKDGDNVEFFYFMGGGQ